MEKDCKVRRSRPYEKVIGKNRHEDELGNGQEAGT